MESKLEKLLKKGRVLRIIHIHWCDLMVTRLETRRGKLVGYSETGDTLTDITRAVNGSVGEVDPESLKAINNSTTNGRGVQVGFNPEAKVFVAQTTGFFGQVTIQAEDPDSPWKAMSKACLEAQQQMQQQHQ